MTLVSTDNSWTGAEKLRTIWIGVINRDMSTIKHFNLQTEARKIGVVRWSNSTCSMLFGQNVYVDSFEVYFYAIKRISMTDNYSDVFTKAAGRTLFYDTSCTDIHIMNYVLGKIRPS